MSTPRHIQQARRAAARKRGDAERFYQAMDHESEPMRKKALADYQRMTPAQRAKRAADAVRRQGGTYALIPLLVLTPALCDAAYPLVRSLIP